MSEQRKKKIGVLLGNLGTPEKPTIVGLWRYLREFLLDKRIVGLPRALWWPLLHFVVLPLRAPVSAKMYAKVWTTDGSPLLVFSKAQQVALQRQLQAEVGEDVTVSFGMRYGKPSIKEALNELKAKSPSELVILPLFPQYASASSGSYLEQVFYELRHWRHIPSLRVIADFHQHPGYIHCLAESVRQFFREHFEPEVLLCSFHGLPAVASKLGDPYESQCRYSAALLQTELGLSAERFLLSFQSRFGVGEWLGPSTEETVVNLAQKGLKSLAIICPGFVSDCLETLEEINRSIAHVFHNAGGEDFLYVPALNKRDCFIKFLSELIKEKIY